MFHLALYKKSFLSDPFSLAQKHPLNVTEFLGFAAETHV